MAKVRDCEAKTEEILLPILAKHGFELVDVEYVKEAGNRYLRAYIDKEGGITIDDCEVVSRALSDRLDEEDFIEEAYILEVSSPGLTRPLKKPKDFERNLGKMIEFGLFTAVNGTKEFTAKLTAFSDDDITAELADGTQMRAERKNIRYIRQAFTDEI
ncbi:MAG: ribosome maturation factor RimP [Lachnospiraceae bacterium]|nr:ribosome maturation factor RimP [Lachnospiraceae bacterium]